MQSRSSSISQVQPDETFDQWALRTNWNAKPWYERLWLSITRRGYVDPPCAHEFIPREFQHYEKGKDHYYRRHYWNEGFCPKCGERDNKVENYIIHPWERQTTWP